MNRIETDVDYPDSPGHGSDGPVYVRRTFSFDGPMAARDGAIIGRALDMGLPPCADINTENPYGVTVTPYNIRDGRRLSTTVTYLDPARPRANLDVVADATVLSLRLAGHRVEGVVYELGGQIHTVAGDQVLLAAGVYHTPQIMMLSGIGPPPDIERLGIPPAHRLPGVGHNYQDHAVVFMTFEARERPGQVGNVSGYRLFIKSDPSLSQADFHIIPRGVMDIAGLKRTMAISAALLEQRNRGHVRLQSTDPHELPLVESGMLEDPRDVQAMLSAMRFIQDLVSEGAPAEYYGALLQPAPDQDWARFAVSTFDSYHHGVGTCLMGPPTNDMAVVDERLRVHGLDNLWVGDASVMPTVTHANTNLAAIMIGERAADFIAAAGRPTA
jgi:choline dehydrogenase